MSCVDLLEGLVRNDARGPANEAYPEAPMYLFFGSDLFSSYGFSHAAQKGSTFEPLGKHGSRKIRAQP